MIQNLKIIKCDVEVKTEDSVLKLSTCANNNKYRVVLHAKKNRINIKFGDNVK